MFNNFYDMICKKAQSYKRSHHRIEYVYNFFKQLKNKEFFENMSAMTGFGYNDDIAFRVCKYGEFNNDKVIYLLSLKKMSGFMAMYIYTLRMLRVVDLFGFTPVIEWESRLYQRNTADNIFEYFFNPINEISVEEALKSSYVVRPNGSHKIKTANTVSIYPISDEEIIVFNKLIEKYFHLNNDTYTIINNSINNLLQDSNILGVHVRAGDFKLRLKNHPVPVEPDEYITEIKKALKEHNFEKIFLATDDDDVVNIFKKEFGTMLIYYDKMFKVANRTELLESKRDDHNYLLGLEVLIDVYTLAACSGLIAGLSNVPNAAQCINGNNYKYKKIINKGIYGYDVPVKFNQATMKKIRKKYKYY